MDEQPEDEITPADIDQTARNRALNGKHAGYLNARHKRDQMVAFAKAGIPLMDSVKMLTNIDGTPGPVAWGTYKKWRQHWPQFAHEYDAARVSDPAQLAVHWTSGFAKFRKQYFGMDSPWFHLELVDVLDNAEPGSITLVLWPPEHGKTTLLEDYCNYKLGTDPSFLIGYGSERSDHGEKVLGRVRNRMEVDGPAKEYVNAFGPFAPQTGSARGDRTIEQPWGAKKFNVFKKGNHDERDYSMVAAGIMAAVQGSRFRLLVLDDMQGLKSYTQTKAILEKLRQDWFTRPGPEDRIVIVGTRVGEDDIYRALMDETDEITGKPLIDRIIIRPAIDNEGKYLWPERYSPEAYERMRRRVGPKAWARNYMQRPRDAGEASFSDEIITAACDPLWAWENPIPDWVLELAITVDPALGGQNAITVQGWGNDRLAVLDTDGRWGLTRSEQIIGVVGDMLALWNGRRTANGTEVRVTHVVIEEMAFQRGLPNDERLKELQRQYGFFVIPHQTGHNKNDPDLGVTGMALSMMRGEIVLPGAMDATTRARMDPLKDELARWRPGRKGTKLKQDRVMALWFGWLQWRIRRLSLTGKTDHAPRGAALPFRKMSRPALPKPTQYPSLFKTR